MMYWLRENWYYIIAIIVAISLCLLFRQQFLSSRHTNIIFKSIMTEEEYYKAFPNTDWPYDIYKSNEILRRMD